VGISRSLALQAHKDGKKASHKGPQWGTGVKKKGLKVAGNVAETHTKGGHNMRRDLEGPSIQKNERKLERPIPDLNTGNSTKERFQNKVLREVLQTKRHGKTRLHKSQATRLQRKSISYPRKREHANFGKGKEMWGAGRTKGRRKGEKCPGHPEL